LAGLAVGAVESSQQLLESSFAPGALLPVSPYPPRSWWLRPVRPRP